MRKSRYSEEQIIGALKRAEQGVQVKDIRRELGIINATFYQWCSKYGGLGASDLRRLKAPETENRRLKQMYADLSMGRKIWTIHRYGCQQVEKLSQKTGLEQRSRFSSQPIDSGGKALVCRQVIQPRPIQDKQPLPKCMIDLRKDESPVRFEGIDHSVQRLILRPDDRLQDTQVDCAKFFQDLSRFRHLNRIAVDRASQKDRNLADRQVHRPQARRNPRGAQAFRPERKPKNSHAKRWAASTAPDCLLRE